MSNKHTVEMINFSTSSLTIKVFKCSACKKWAGISSSHYPLVNKHVLEAKSRLISSKCMKKE